MQIIPVIDLKDGQVVHAVRGLRSQYRPIHLGSGIVDASDLGTVISGFLSLHAFKTIYIADLNAIMGDGDHQSLIAGMVNDYPEIVFWLDTGCQLASLATINLPDNVRPVIGTESQLLPPAYSDQPYILSLDYKQQASGHADWFTASDVWPQDIIVMTLNRVGSNSGPDFEKLAELSGAYPGKNFVAAGGIRDMQDLRRLAEMGINAALLASALHAGAITGKEIGEFQAKKYPGKAGYF